MNGVMDENQLTVVKELEFDNPPVQKIDALIDNSIRDCHHKYFRTFDHTCEYDLNFKNITNNESVNFTISDKSMGMYELNKKLTIARGNDFIFNQINKLTIKTFSNLSNINIHYHLLLGASPLHRQFFKKKFLKIVIIFKHFATTVEIHFILHVANGILITIQVYLYEFIYKY